MPEVGSWFHELPFGCLACTIASMTSEAVRAFLHKSEECDFKSACEAVAFSRVSHIFAQRGVSRNVTDDECAKWLYQVVSRPVAQMLRGAVLKPKQADAERERIRQLCENFSAIVAEGASLRTQATDRVLRAIVTLLLVMSHESLATPSEIRSVLSEFKKLPPKDPLSLGLKHGEMGKDMARRAHLLVQHNEKDTMADQKLDDSLAHLNGWLTDIGPSKSFAMLKNILLEVQGCLALWTKIGFEQRLPDLERFAMLLCVGLGELRTMVINDFEAPLDKVAKHLAAHAQARTLPSPASGDLGLSAGAQLDVLAEPQPVLFDDEVVVAIMQLVAEVCQKTTPFLKDADAFLGSCAKLEKNMAERASGMTRTLKSEVGQRVVTMQAEVAAIQDLLQALMGVQALSKSAAAVPYGDALRAWSNWQMNVKRDDCEKPTPMPSLQYLVLGTDACMKLCKNGAWAEFEHESNDFQSLLRFSSGPVSTMLLPSMAARVSSMFADALASSDKLLLTHALALRGVDEVAQMAKSGSLSDVPRLLFSDGGGKFIELREHIEEREKQAAGFEALWSTGDPTWPHLDAIEMSKRFLNIAGDTVQACRLGLSEPPPNRSHQELPPLWV